MTIRNTTLALLATTAMSFVGSAYAADVYVPPAEPAYAPAPDAFSWSGVYFGVHVGYAKAKAVNPWPSCDWLTDIRGENGDPGYIFPGATSCDAYYLYYGAMALDGDYIYSGYYGQSGSNSGFVWGGQVGINHQYGSLVLGLEADISGISNINHTVTDAFDYLEYYVGNGYAGGYDGTYWVQSNTKLDWLATFRGRAGIALGAEGRFMPYITGGVAVAHVSNSLETGSGAYYGPTLGWCDAGSVPGCGFGEGNAKSFFQFGYAAGAGVEWAFNNHVSVGLEYLFVGLPWGKQTNSVTFYGDDGRSFNVNQVVGFDSVQMLKLKLNLKL